MGWEILCLSWKIEIALLSHVIFCLLIHVLLIETLTAQRVCEFVSKFLKIRVAKNVVFCFGGGLVGEDF